MTEEEYTRSINRVKALAQAIKDVKNRRHNSILRIWLGELAGELGAETQRREFLLVHHVKCAVVNGGYACTCYGPDKPI